MEGLFDAREAQKLKAKWAPVLEAGPAIDSEEKKLTTAMVLETTHRSFVQRGLIVEAETGMDSGIAGTGSASTGVLGANDFHWPSMVIPMVRRIFPALISQEIVGVQPMTGPIGFAFAFRAMYGVNGILGDGSFNNPTANDVNGITGATGAEIGYNNVFTQYTGTSSVASTGTAASYWSAYAGTKINEGQGAALGTDTEYAKLNDKYPMAKFQLIKQGVEAKTRKLGAQWSPEVAEDMMAMHGIDVESEMVNTVTYEIAAEIDRQLLNEQVKVAITGGKTSDWTPVSADGRNQIERIGTLLTHLNTKSNKIAEATRRGSANFCIASTGVTSILQRLAADAFQPASKGAIPSLPNSGVGSLIKVGLINGGAQLLIRDTFAGGDYALLGYKGEHRGDSGVVYCPYIPVQMIKAMNPETLTPVLGARTRYGVLNNVWGSANYFQFVRIVGLADTNVANEYGSLGQRVFTFG
jgi:hypothetical protein